MPEPKTKRGELLRQAYRETEHRMVLQANRSAPSEVDEQEVIVGRQREAQLILEAERHAARAKGAS